MDMVAVESLRTQVLAATFGLCVLFGVIAQRSHFCAMGALADVVSMGDFTRLRTWVLAIAVATAGFQTLAALGWIDPAATIYTGPRVPWLSALVGGLLFGVGMVLASGCGSKTLLRIGAGNLKALVVFIVLGLSAFATLRGITAVARVATIDRVAWDLPTGQGLPALLAHATGLPPATATAWAACVVVALCVAWVLRREEGRRAEVWFAGAGIGLVIVGVWAVSGNLGFVAEHPETLEPAYLATASKRMEALSFVAPLAHSLDWLIYFSDASQRLTLGVAAVAGVVAGSALHALATRSFRWEGFRDAADTGRHLTGAVLMGVGGVTALGCTVGQGLSGVSTLSLGSLIALAAIVAGALGTLRWQAWRIERGLL